MYDVIVAGTGSMGAAACLHLARRGARVLGLEQFGLPHERGSHHGHSRMIRQAYFEHPDYVPLLRRAYELWDEVGRLEADAGHGDETIFHRTGGLYVGPPDGAIVPGSLAAARAHDLPHELLDGEALAARFPQFRFPAGFQGFFEERAGFLVPERAVAAQVRQARLFGAEVRTGETVLDWKTTRDGVRVRTSGGDHDAGHLVVTAGAWSGPLLADLGVDLTVTRQVLAWFDPPGDRAQFALGRFPCWFVETDTPYGHYGFPMCEFGQPGLKVALHKPGEPIAPEDLGTADPGPRADEIELLRATLRAILPDGAGPLVAACTCRYTNSADGHFIVGPHPHDPGVTLAAGFSGHGFKFASVIGEILADLATEGWTALPAGFLGIERLLRP